MYLYSYFEETERERESLWFFSLFSRGNATENREREGGEARCSTRHGQADAFRVGVVLITVPVPVLVVVGAPRTPRAHAAARAPGGETVGETTLRRAQTCPWKLRTDGPRVWHLRRSLCRRNCRRRDDRGSSRSFGLRWCEWAVACIAGEVSRVRSIALGRGVGRR